MAPHILKMERVTEDSVWAAAHPTGEDVLDVDDVGLGRVVRLRQLFVEPVDQEAHRGEWFRA